MERQRPFRREGFTEEEADVIVRRAVELQQQAGPVGRIQPRELEESAEVAGVAPEFVQQAITELQAQQAAARQRVAPVPAARLRLTVLAALIAFGISMLLMLLISHSPRRAHRVPAQVAPVAVEVVPPAPPAPPARPTPPTHR